MGKKGKIALLLGLAAGTATGLLFAPEKGKNLRSNIAKERKAGGTGLKAVKDDLVKMGDDVVDAMEEVVNSAEVQKLIKMSKSKAEEQIADKKKKLDKMVKDANKRADQMKKRAAKYAKEQKDLLDGEVRSLLGLPKKKKSTRKRKKK